jgi:hypothetical protein
MTNVVEFIRPVTVVHMNSIGSSFYPKGERQAGVGEKSTDSIQDGQMSSLNSAVLRVSIRKDLVGQYTVLCKQFLECLRGRLGSHCLYGSSWWWSCNGSAPVQCTC